jgi:hypothetical protein
MLVLWNRRSLETATSARDLPSALIIASMIGLRTASSRTGSDVPQIGPALYPHGSDSPPSGRYTLMRCRSTIQSFPTMESRARAAIRVATAPWRSFGETRRGSHDGDPGILLRGE